MDITLITQRADPEPTASDELLAAALRRRGHDVRGVAWNAPGVDVGSFGDLAVLRSCWDYHRAIEDFEAWLDGVEAAGTRIVNPPDLVRWTLRKTYLADLASLGLPFPETAVLSVGDVLPDWIHRHERVVAKPEIGASGVGVELLDTSGIDDHLRVHATAGRRIVLQEFVEDIGDGEWALVYLGGEFSHGFQRVPPEGEFRVNGGYGGFVRPGAPSPELVTLGLRALATLPMATAYARVDVVVAAGGPVLMEVEINEPSLRLDLGDDAPDRFAEAVLGL